LGGYGEGAKGNDYAMWRLFAIYVLQQFNVDESDYKDDLLYQWVRTVTPGFTSARGLYELGTVLADPEGAWHDRLAPGDETRTGKLCALFQDWAIAKAIDDTTRIAPGDSVTLGFGRGFSPYEDAGLFRDVDTVAANTGVLPSQHELGDTCLNKVTWITQYYHPSDSPPPAQPDYIRLKSWASDYILFTPTSYFETGEEGPYDLKVLVRGDFHNRLPYQGAGQRLQVSIVTYSSADDVFKSGEDVINVQKFQVEPDSGKVDLTMPGFGNPVKAALVILGLTGYEVFPDSDYVSIWNYKYAYAVAPHWTSGSISEDMVWVDSIRVNGNLVVEEGATLTVTPGACVTVAEGCSLKVLGTLVAAGDLTNAVKFRSSEANPQPGDWLGIYVDGTLEMSRCSVQWADKGVYAAESSAVTIDDCWFTDFLDYGIDVSGPGSTLEVTNTTLESQSADGGIRGTAGTLMTVEDCTVGGHVKGCVTVSGEESILDLAECDLETNRKDGAGVIVSNGARATVNSVTIAGDADSLTYGLKCDGSLAKTYTDVEGLTIADQKYGIYSNLNMLSVVGTEVSGFSNTGLRFLGSGTCSLSVRDSRLSDAASGATGLYAYNSPYANLVRDTIECAGSNGKYGIEFLGVSGNLRPAEVESTLVSGFQNNLIAQYMDLGVSYCTFSDFTNDGIRTQNSDVTISHNNVQLGSTGVRGIELLTGTTGAVQYADITCTDSSSIKYGVVSSGDASATLDYIWIAGVKYGIKCSGSSGPEISSCRILRSTGNAIQCTGSGAPVIRYTTFDDSKGTVVAVTDQASPDLGMYPDSGSCRFKPNATFSYFVANLTEDPVYALLNWWDDEDGPDPSKFYGDVNYAPYLTSDPGVHYARPVSRGGSTVPAATFALQNYPNPFNPKTTFEYGVRVAGTHVRIAVYDISGRVVRVLVDEARPAGRFSIVWDGTNERGEVVASGVYFSDVAIGDFRKTQKLVVLK
ncbi:MAG: right-handed parallel beta-helix repeat-containing protein, partial [Candidatus Eisenbacteria bacterium]